MESIISLPIGTLIVIRTIVLKMASRFLDIYVEIIGTLMQLTQQDCSRWKIHLDTEFLFGK
ncbi:hypothetical protein O0Q50_12565 [Priestia aryabhattai]|uniref:Uncharacterized protein n=1 Tax=Priestia aryabhattai TaxID=412384 RepID=A0AAX6N7Y1_PRIAR|nr:MULTISPECIES: hypothetical protein [Priestia]MDU9692001.1 hypothetical protein [Priestia aryabhattai]TPF16741.1 hypothetical protein CBE78_10710 [Priestia megaterium]TPF24284.1 hypothetical protein CBE79_15920 [Priestia megaterium]